MDTYKKLVGDRIRKARIEAGFPKQEHLAKAMGIDRSRISRWETGENLPKGELYASLLALLKITDEELMGSLADRPAQGAPAERPGPDLVEAARWLSSVARAKRLHRLIALHVLTKQARYLEEIRQFQDPEAVQYLAYVKSTA